MDDPDTGQARIASGVNVLAGLWLIIAPWVLGYGESETAVWNQTVIGVAVAVLALIRTAAPAQFAALSWINFVFGAWLLVSAFVLQYEPGVAVESIVWNNVIAAIVILAMATWSAMATSQRR